MLLTSLLPKLQTVLSYWEVFSPFYFSGPPPTLYVLQLSSETHSNFEVFTSCC